MEITRTVDTNLLQRGNLPITISLSQIDDFPNHPFHVRMDEDMVQLVESVKQSGIITPVLVRRKEAGRYEMVSGHRRKKACELAGLESIPAEVREMSRDEAIIWMVDSNLQRSTILPSEKAFSYKMRLDAMSRQGERRDSEWKPRSDAVLADQVGESRNQVQRYIRLTCLVPELLELVDTKRIAFRPAVELSYLSVKEQNALCEIIACQEATPSLSQAIKLKKLSQEGKLDEEVMVSLMEQEKPNQREKLTFRADRLREYIPASIPPAQTEDYVVKALKFYQRYREMRRAQER